MLVVLLAACANVTKSTDVQDISVLTVRREYANAHVVESPDGVFLVDPGAEHLAPDVDATMRDAGYDPAKLRAVLLTHGHADHAGAAAWFARQYGTPVVAGAADWERFATGTNDMLCPTNARAERMVHEHQGLTFTPFEPTVWLSDSETLEAIGLPGVTATPVPGHTDGSVVYSVGNTLFAGDLLRGSILGKSARTHFYICDETDNRADVDAVADEVAPNASMWFVGHFGPLHADAIDAWRGK